MPTSLTVADARRAKVATLAHYRRQAADAQATNRLPPAITVSLKDVARAAWAKDAAPANVSLDMLEQLVDLTVRQTIGFSAAFTPIRIELGNGHRLVCTLEVPR